MSAVAEQLHLPNLEETIEHIARARDRPARNHRPAPHRLRQGDPEPQALRVLTPDPSQTKGLPMLAITTVAALGIALLASVSLLVGFVTGVAVVAHQANKATERARAAEIDAKYWRGRFNELQRWIDVEAIASAR